MTKLHLPPVETRQQHLIKDLTSANHALRCPLCLPNILQDLQSIRRITDTICSLAIVVDSSSIHGNQFLEPLLLIPIGVKQFRAGFILFCSFAQYEERMIDTLAESA